VDYGITSCDNFSTLVDFHVHDFNEFSNYAPLSFYFKAQTYRRETNSKHNKYYKFDSKYRDEFILEVLNGVTDIERDLSSEIQNNGDVDKLTTLFTEFLGEKGKRYFGKNVKNVKNQFTTYNNNKTLV